WAATGRRQLMSAETSFPTAPKATVQLPGNPSIRLLATLAVTVIVILAFCLYTVHEVQQLRDAQTRISERNRLDSVQLLRIQNNLSEPAFSMGAMARRTEWDAV